MKDVRNSIILCFISILVCIVFYAGHAFASFSNMRAEWQDSCGSVPPQVPNKALDLSWDYTGEASSLCRLTVTDSNGLWDEYDIECQADVIEYSGQDLNAGKTYSWKVAKLDSNNNIIDQSNTCSFIATEPESLPSKRDHIRLYRTFPSDNEITTFGYDLSFTDGTINDLNHKALPYEVNTEMMTPYQGQNWEGINALRKADALRQWWCIRTGLQCNENSFPDNWLCEDVTACDIPEDIFMHFEVDTFISLPYKFGETSRQSLIVKGWDPGNPTNLGNVGDINGDGVIDEDDCLKICSSAAHRQEARVPSFYWGDYWRYLTGQAVPSNSLSHSNFGINLGNAEYIEFMSIEYMPDLFNRADFDDVDGVYFDDGQGYGPWWTDWGKDVGFVEYNNVDEFLSDDAKLFKEIKENTPLDKIILSNGWHYTPHIIEGHQRESALNITLPYNDFGNRDIKTSLKAISDELNRGIISAIQFFPANAIDDSYSTKGAAVPFERSRDQIYGLALYYLFAGDTSYFAYGSDGDNDVNNLFFEGINVNVGNPVGDYYLFSEEYGQGENVIANGNFTTAVVDNDPNCMYPYCDDPEGWNLPQNNMVQASEALSITSDQECDLIIDNSSQGKCAKINSVSLPWKEFPNHIYSQNVSLLPNTTYTLSSFLRSESITGGELFYGANFFPYDFEDSTPPLTGCNSNLRGTMGWTSSNCIFTTGADIEGRVNFRIQFGIGTAWFDNIELREGLPRIVLARDYTNALVLVRPRATDEVDYDDPVTYDLGGLYFPLGANGNIGDPVSTITLHASEAAILIKDSDGDGLNNVAELQTGSNPLHPDTDRDTVPDGQDSDPLNIFVPNPEGWNLSRNSDFSTSDNAFSTNDTMHILVWSNRVNAGNMKKDEYKLKGAVDQKEDLNPDPSAQIHSAAADISMLPPGPYTFEFWVEDWSRNRYQEKNITISIQ